MATRWRAPAVTAAAVAGLLLAGGVTTATASGQGAAVSGLAAMNFYQFHGHYPTHDECVAVAQEFLWPTNPGGADDYECRARDGGWDLYLIFAT